MCRSLAYPIHTISKCSTFDHVWIWEHNVTWNLSRKPRVANFNRNSWNFRRSHLLAVEPPLEFDEVVVLKEAGFGSIKDNPDIRSNCPPIKWPGNLKLLSYPHNQSLEWTCFSWQKERTFSGQRSEKAWYEKVGKNVESSEEARLNPPPRCWDECKKKTKRAEFLQSRTF